MNLVLVKAIEIRKIFGPFDLIVSGAVLGFPTKYTIKFLFDLTHSKNATLKRSKWQSHNRAFDFCCSILDSVCQLNWFTRRSSMRIAKMKHSLFSIMWTSSENTQYRNWHNNKSKYVCRWEIYTLISGKSGAIKP